MTITKEHIGRSELLAELEAERASIAWWSAPDNDAAEHRRELADALAGYRDPDYQRRMHGELTHHERARATIEDVEWMLYAGETASSMSCRLGLAPGTIAKRLARAGRHDLARHFYHH